MTSQRLEEIKVIVAEDHSFEFQFEHDIAQELITEIERLRAALREIVSLTHEQLSMLKINKVATKALEGSS